MTDKQKNLIVRTVTGILFVTIMVLGFLRPDTMILLFAIITGMAMWEYTGLVNNIEGVEVNRFISTVAAVFFFVAVAAWRIHWVDGFGVFVPYILTVMYLLIAELYMKHENAVRCMAYTMLGQMYIALPFSMVNILAFQELDGQVAYYMWLPLSIFIFLWSNDTGAYCTGSLIGKHKLFPRISPGKTWEGSIGGGILVIIISGVIGYIANNYSSDPHTLSVAGWIGLGIVVAVFGTWGDLVESLFKRTLGIKDSGNILPGHGGMLDRFDSAIIALPAAVVYLYSLTIF